MILVDTEQLTIHQQATGHCTLHFCTVNNNSCTGICLPEVFRHCCVRDLSEISRGGGVVGVLNFGSEIR